VPRLRGQNIGNMVGQYPGGHGGWALGKSARLLKR
jgi:hypothetical protein